jgi:hypothetical protein
LPPKSFVATFPLNGIISHLVGVRGTKPGPTA